MFITGYNTLPNLELCIFFLKNEKSKPICYADQFANAIFIPFLNYNSSIKLIMRSFCYECNEVIIAYLY